MNLTIALFVSLFCGLIWAQDDAQASVVVEDSGTSRPCLVGFDLQREFSAMKDKLTAMETRLNKETKTIAFSAVTGGGNQPIGPFDTATTLVYRTVITNVGNFYNQHTGIFTAPVPGLYYFTIFYHAGGQYRPVLSLLKNNQVVVGTSDHQSSDTADNGGNAVYVQLQQGDQVLVQMAANSHVWGNDELTTFSGLLVRQD